MNVLFFLFFRWCKLFLGSLETLTDILPVHNIPDGLNIVRSNVLVLEIVRMLPDIYPKQWDQTSNLKGKQSKEKCFKQFETTAT